MFVAILNVSHCFEQGPVGPMTLPEGQQHPSVGSLEELEHPGLQQLRDESDPSVVSVSAGAPTTRFVNSSNNFRNGKQKGQPGGKSQVSNSTALSHGQISNRLLKFKTQVRY